MFLNDNQLTGGIPAAFADVDPDTPEGLTALTYLTLYNNLLTTPATFIVAPSDSTVRLPLSESDGATEFTAQVEIDDPGTLWASGFADPLGLEDDNLATGAITASLSGTADVVVVAVAPDSYDFAIGAAETITGDLTFTLTPTANGVDQDDETVTFSVSGMGAPGGTGTMLAAEAIEVVVENNDALPTPTPPTIRRPPTAPTPTHTPTPAAILIPTPTLISALTPTMEPTPTRRPRREPDRTPRPTATATPVPTPTVVAQVATPTPTATALPTLMPTATPRPTAKPMPTPGPTATPLPLTTSPSTSGPTTTTLLTATPIPRPR